MVNVLGTRVSLDEMPSLGISIRWGIPVMVLVAGAVVGVGVLMIRWKEAGNRRSLLELFLLEVLVLTMVMGR